jgi:NADPH2:quinone reductase
MSDQSAAVRRWLVREHGPPADVLELHHGPVPPADETEVVIDVSACALNFADDLLCRGTYQEKPPVPFSPGLELAGVVTDAGPTSRHSVGDRVVGSARLPFGALAERAKARSDDVYHLPDGVSAVDAVAMHVTYQTCWFALHRRARVQPGDTLLVHAGAGGIGSAAIQLGKAAGARVIATAGGAEKVDRCGTLGADVSIDYQRDDFVAVVKELTDGLGADIILDPVGGETFERSRRCIAWEGRILVVGAASGGYFSAPTNHVMVKNYSIVGVHWGGYLTRNPELVRGAHDDLMRLYRAGTVKPLVSRVAPLEDARDALVELAGGRTTGKIVVTP